MKRILLARMGRRAVFRAAAAGAAIAVTGTSVCDAAAAEATASTSKRRARYQADASEVQNFYRVAHYPARREK